MATMPVDKSVPEEQQTFYVAAWVFASMLIIRTLQMGYGPKRNTTGQCLQSHYISWTTQ